MSSWRIGVDVGGTFTDVVALESSTGRLEIGKVPTTPENPAIGVLDGLQALQASKLDGGTVSAFLHGTTIGTNALLELKGAIVGLLVSEGFRGVPQVQTGSVGAEQYDPTRHRPPSLVAPWRIREIPERVDRYGAVVRPIDLDAVRRAATELRQAGATSIAVCYMFSYANPSHERMTKEIIQEACPVGSSRVDLQACKLEYSIVSPK